jgi:hypothetical protein
MHLRGLKSSIVPKLRGDQKKNRGFTITLSPQAIEMIESLIQIGLHGTSRAEVARKLINDRLEDLIGRGVIKPPSTGD